MAVYMLLSFEDEEMAKIYVSDSLAYPQHIAPVVCGVWKKATQFCDEPFSRHGKGKTGAGWTRGKKYGWWVCVICGKPSGVAAKVASTPWELALGTNLLPPECSPEFFQKRLYRSDVEWKFLLPSTVEETSVVPSDVTQ